MRALTMRPKVIGSHENLPVGVIATHPTCCGLHVIASLYPVFNRIEVRTSLLTHSYNLQFSIFPIREKGEGRTGIAEAVQSALCPLILPWL